MDSLFQPLYVEDDYVPVVYSYYDRADMLRTTSTLVNHAHSMIEIMYVNEGNLSIDVEGTVVQLGRRQLIWLDAGVFHRDLHFLTELCGVMNIEFQYEKLDKRCPSLRELSMQDDATRELLLHPTKFMVLTDHDDAIYHLLKQIVPLADSALSQGESLCSLLCTQVMLLVAQFRQESVEKPPTNAYVDAALSILNEEYASPLTASEVAARLYIQPAHLHRLFREHTGESVGAHLQRIRLEKAKERMLTTSDSLLDIALAVGLSSQPRLTQLLKRTEGMTPLKYRKAYAVQPNGATHKKIDRRK
ncbi:MAG: AraC family transcriptional regulator [Eubacteriales bacterium]|nr:AraC family transcriptional regulator [Eubacteriales bacterium]